MTTSRKLSMIGLLLSCAEQLGRVTESYRRVNEATSDSERALRMSRLRVDIKRLADAVELAYELATEATERIGAEDEVKF